MNLQEEIKSMGVDAVDRLLVEVTPDDVLDGIKDLVLVAASKTMTGQEKAEWVANEAKELAWNLFDFLVDTIVTHFLPQLVELVYRAVQDQAKEIKNGSQKTVTE